jgi:uncharacterized protein (UPF0261 family)
MSGGDDPGDSGGDGGGFRVRRPSQDGAGDRPSSPEAGAPGGASGDGDSLRIRRAHADEPVAPAAPSRQTAAPERAAESPRPAAPPRASEPPRPAERPRPAAGGDRAPARSAGGADEPVARVRRRWSDADEAPAVARPSAPSSDPRSRWGGPPPAAPGTPAAPGPTRGGPTGSGSAASGMAGSGGSVVRPSFVHSPTIHASSVRPASGRSVAGGVGAAYVAGTFDTKGRELLFLKTCLQRRGLRAVTVDLGTSDRPSPADIGPREVARHHPGGVDAVFTGDRGTAVAAMAEAFAAFLPRQRDLGGVISAGGSGGTALVTPGMRALPVGVPKVMVSTVASGDVKPYVGPSDICMMYSVTDVQGLNRISRRVLANAANALAGMVANLTEERAAPDAKPAIGLTMFGVTTPCVRQVVEALEARFDCLVFHATGTGGQSMEKLVDSGMLAGVIDATTTEVADLHMGGVMSAGEDRLGAVIRTGVPYVGSCGALDMVNFGARDTVPERYRHRTFYEHNPQVTLMRTTAEENDAMGRWIAGRLNRCEGPVRFLIPEGGVSALDAPGQAFWDPVADDALFRALEDTFEPTDRRRLVRLPFNVNDPAFSDELVRNFLEIAGVDQRKTA